jgi:hypothetical protein
MLQLHFSTPKGRRAAPLAREAGEGERQGAPPCAPTPLSHPVGEGLGVRAKSVAPLSYPVGEGLEVMATDATIRYNNSGHSTGSR